MGIWRGPGGHSQWMGWKPGGFGPLGAAFGSTTALGLRDAAGARLSSAAAATTAQGCPNVPRPAPLAVSMQLVLGSARATRAANGAPPLAPSPKAGSVFGGRFRRGSIRGGAPRITREGACAPQFHLNRSG
jgi:hypothetical protein